MVDVECIDIGIDLEEIDQIDMEDKIIYYIIVVIVIREIELGIMDIYLVHRVFIAEYLCNLFYIFINKSFFVNVVILITTFFWIFEKKFIFSKNKN